MAADPWPARGDWGHLVPYNAFKRVSENYSAPERAAMFHDTAARVYRIDV
jgi:predicted TIM-barrel fold metal-dependent hydrolase